VPEKFERKRPAGSAPAPAAARSAGGGGGSPSKPSFFGSRVSPKKLAQFTSQLSTLQGAGITIVRSLRICEGQLKPGPLKAVVGAVADDVEGGATFSEALGKHPDIFDRLFTNMVRAGEKGGILDQILARLADFGEKTERLKGRVKEALAYPVVVMFFALAVVTFVMVVIVPKFEDIFRQFNQELPAITQVLIDISRGIAQYWYAVFGAPIALFIGYKLGLRNSKFKFTVDGIKLKLPIAGVLVEKTVIARFSRTLGTLLSAGVPILEALEIVESSIENSVISKAVADVRAAVREGDAMAAPLMESKVFDDIVVNMIDVGEATGSLDKMLVKIAEVYEDEVEVQVGTLFKLLEPVLIMFLALVVGTIVIALFLPILKVMESLQGAR
jgi:type IV pilus assembly protein PilC